eukprot:5974683-Prymnesium_polylepis.1
MGLTVAKVGLLPQRFRERAHVRRVELGQLGVVRVIALLRPHLLAAEALKHRAVQVEVGDRVDGRVDDGAVGDRWAEVRL